MTTNTKPKNIIPAQWGKDHWSILCYLETRVVDHRGKIDMRNLRTDGVTYPTYLKHSKKLFGHNDSNCIDDLEVAGLIKNNNDTISLTEIGWKVSAELRRHKASQKSYTAFSTKLI